VARSDAGRFFLLRNSRFAQPIHFDGYLEK
jgi:hypothetical protein